MEPSREDLVSFVECLFSVNVGYAWEILGGLRSILEKFTNEELYQKIEETRSTESLKDWMAIRGVTAQSVGTPSI